MEIDRPQHPEDEVSPGKQGGPQAEGQRQRAPAHPLAAERACLQRALEALEACPPRGGIEALLWHGLRWAYQRRLRRTDTQWERWIEGRQASGDEATYPFEPEMIPIPGGAFLMGSDPQEDGLARSAEQPQHEVSLPDYSLARTPVTNAQYAAFVEATGHSAPRYWRGSRPPWGRGQHPVISVTWYDAVAYCRWLVQETGKPYRLPTEAEWEKGARGTEGRRYPWGAAWDARRCNTKEGGREDTTPVGRYPEGASPYGLLDMAGNVWEWTSSLYWAYPYQADDGREDLTTPESRVLRGGSFLDLYDSARAAYRRSYVPAYHSRTHGFRVGMSGS
jgi:formylglycine-generating enzyme required for sulfatase activity